MSWSQLQQFMHNDQTGTAMATTEKPRFTNKKYAYMYLNSLLAQDR
jgi:predicted RNA-binding protein (virulence factor B family)